MIDFVKTFSINQVIDVSERKNGLTTCLTGLGSFINEQELLQLSEEANDEGTTALASDYMQQQKMIVSMFLAFLP